MSDFISLFNIESKTGMFTQDVKIKVDDPDTNKTFTFQIKANSSNSKTGSNLKFEPTMKVLHLLDWVKHLLMMYVKF